MTMGRQESSSLETILDARKLPGQLFQYHNLGIVNILSLMESRARNFVELVQNSSENEVAKC